MILLDWCYLNNLLIVYFLHFDPKNEYLYRFAFLTANGVLAVASFLFGNMGIAHKLDRYVSFTNHLMPAFIIYNLSQVTMPYEATLPESQRMFCAAPDLGSETFFSKEALTINLGIPYAIYISWFITYYLITFCFCNCLFEKYGHINIYIEMGYDPEFKKHQDRAGPFWGPLGFMLCHISFFTISTLIALITLYSVYA